jgi:hypothetical protein
MILLSSQQLLSNSRTRHRFESVISDPLSVFPGGPRPFAKKFALTSVNTLRFRQMPLPRHGMSFKNRVIFPTPYATSDCQLCHCDFSLPEKDGFINVGLRLLSDRVISGRVVSRENCIPPHQTVGEFTER